MTSTRNGSEAGSYSSTSKAPVIGGPGSRTTESGTSQNFRFIMIPATNRRVSTILPVGVLMPDRGGRRTIAIGGLTRRGETCLSGASLGWRDGLEPAVTDHGVDRAGGVDPLAVGDPPAP